MLSPAQTSRSRVISCHLRDIGGYQSTIGYICYCGKEPQGKSKWRPGGVYGRLTHMILSMLIKDRTVVGTSNKIEDMPLTQLAG